MVKPTTNSYFGGQLLHSYPTDEFGKRNEKDMENAPSCRDGTDPARLSPFRITYTTRPTQVFFSSEKREY
uniref:Uncharacterized protein n=1 Tax=Heterorhabditis bacteriophora TaxID=37862 RepID=A0A1I7XBR6_HETBA